MADNIEKIAEGLGAKRIVQVTKTGSGAFGAARLAEIVKVLRKAPEAGDGSVPPEPGSMAERVDRERRQEDELSR